MADGPSIALQPCRTMRYRAHVDQAGEIVARLLREHGAIREFANRFALMLAPEALQDVGEIADCRWEMTKAILQHVAFEDRYAFLPLERDPRIDVAMVAQRFKRELEAIQADFEGHMDRWSTASTKANWTAYRTLALAQNRLLLDRMHREEIELFPYIGSNAEISSGAVPPPPQRNWARSAWDVKDSLGRR